MKNNTITLHTTLSFLIISMISACGSSSDSIQTNNSSSDMPADNTSTDQTRSIDITDVTLTSQLGSCEDYVGNYYANVSDIQRNINFDANIVITSDGVKCTFQANEIPNHDFNDHTASFATNTSEQTGNYQVAVTPIETTNVTDLTLGARNAILLNGVMVDLLAAACYDVGNEPLGQEKIGCGPDQIENPWRYDPMSSLNRFGTDQHNAHTQPDGTYHYHGSPEALFDLACEETAVTSPVIGFAADGFPIFGPCINDNGVIRKVKSSYKLKSGERENVAGYSTPVSGVGVINSASYDGQFRGDYLYNPGFGDLDECNGMHINGQYGYFITNSFPWVLNCFKATIDPTFVQNGAALENTMHSHDEINYHSH